MSSYTPAIKSTPAGMRLSSLSCAPAGIGPTVTKGNEMSDLVTARLAGIHKEFLDAAKSFPHLRFLAVHPHDSLIEWPRFPDGPHGGETLGLSVGCWRQLFGQLDPRSSYALKPLDDVWLRIGGELWQGAFFYGGPDVDSTELRALNKNCTKAMQEFRRLAALAADHFDMPRDPIVGVDGEGLLGAERSDRWLEKLFSLGLAESCDGCLVQVQRLKADVFTASARAIEMLADDKQPPASSDEPEELLLRLGQAYLEDVLTAKTAEVESHPDEVALRKWLADDRVEGKFTAWWHQRIAEAKEWRLEISPAWHVLAECLDILFPGTSNTFNVFSSRRCVQEQELIDYLNRVHGIGRDGFRALTLTQLVSMLQQHCAAHRATLVVSHDTQPPAPTGGQAIATRDPEPKPPGSPEAVGAQEVTDDPALSPGEIAKRYNLDAEAARKRLDRWRSTHDDGVIEVSNRKVNEPKYLYRLSAVRHLFDGNPSGDSSAPRPAE